MTERKMLVSESWLLKLMSADGDEALELVQDLQAYRAGVERPLPTATGGWIHDRLPTEDDGDYCDSAWALDADGDVEFLEISDIIAGFDDTDGCPIIAWQPSGLKAPEVPDAAYFAERGCGESNDESAPLPEKPIGLATALKELEDDDELALWACEVGLIDPAQDSLTMQETYSVVVAAESEKDAEQKILDLATSVIPVVGGMHFILVEDPEQVLASDYTD